MKNINLVVVGPHVATQSIEININEIGGTLEALGYHAKTAMKMSNQNTPNYL